LASHDNPPDTGRDRLIAVVVDEGLGAISPDVEHERKVAIDDLLEENVFKVAGDAQGPYRLKLSIVDKRLLLEVTTSQSDPCTIIGLALSPFRRIVKDYYLICGSYYQAIRTATPSQIETIDMARRGLHNEGSELLIERLKGKIEIDVNTARRLFTLVCVLHWRG
jgi:uncharacterized protein (UPF0262 family)